MKNIAKIVLCFMFVFAFSSFAQAQTVKTITGNLCKSDGSGNYNGIIWLRVGTKVIEFDHQFRLAPGAKESGEIATKYINNPDFGRIGSEFVVRYKTRNEYKIAISIKFTGRLKKTKPCSSD